MTNEKTIKWLDEHALGKLGRGGLEAKITAIKALEKQIEKKVQEGEIEEQMGFYCPCCKNELIQDEEWEYCMFCGQALDWSEQ